MNELMPQSPLYDIVARINDLIGRSNIDQVSLESLKKTNPRVLKEFTDTEAMSSSYSVPIAGYYRVSLTSTKGKVTIKRAGVADVVLTTTSSMSDKMLLTIGSELVFVGFDLPRTAVIKVHLEKTLLDTLEEVVNLLKTAESRAIASNTAMTNFATQQQSLIDELRLFANAIEPDKLTAQFELLGEKDAEYASMMVNVSHLLDDGRDLLEENGILYRKEFEVINNDPYLIYNPVGISLLNDIKTVPVDGTMNLVRVYWKAQATTSGILLVHTSAEANRFYAEVSNRTRQYSAVFDLTGDRNIAFSSIAAWNNKINIWDVDWRGEE